MSGGSSSGLTVWLTGLPGSGKSTSASFLLDRLAAGGVVACALDGDALRAGISSDLGFSAEDRDENVRRAGELSVLLAGQGAVVVVSLVSPRRAARDAVRARHQERAIRFLEVHVAAPLEVCEERDPKALYRRARQGSISHMTGVDDPYEAPLAAEVVLATHERSEHETGTTLTEAVVAALRAAGP